MCVLCVCVQCVCQPCVIHKVMHGFELLRSGRREAIGKQQAVQDWGQLDRANWAGSAGKANLGAGPFSRTGRHQEA